MEVFINEISLNEQYLTNTEFEEGVKKIAYLLSRVNKLQKSTLYADIGMISIYSAIQNEYFDQSFNNIQDRSLKIAFRNLYYNKQNVENWRTTQVIDENVDYFFEDENVKNTGVAEITERKIRVNFKPYLLINFSNSKFSGNNAINILKEGETIVIFCSDDGSSFEYWLENDYHKFIFNYDASLAPTDNQTILRDHTKFDTLDINNKPGGRRIYREIATGNIWYVDSFHKGKGAHLEVFNNTGKIHIGEADIEGNITEGTNVNGRTINL